MSEKISLDSSDSFKKNILLFPFQKTPITSTDKPKPIIKSTFLQLSVLYSS